MKSPFPGMDPYIEACGLWEGFHNRLMMRISFAIAEVLPKGYFVDSAKRRYVVLTESEDRKKPSSRSDKDIEQPPSRRRSQRTGRVPARKQNEDSDSVPMQAFIAEPFDEIFVEIFVLDGDRNRHVVTRIEALSPSNKRRDTRGWQEYLRKRQALLLGEANFIELDLVRGGDKMPMMTPWPDSPYTLLVSSAFKAPYCRVWKGYFQRRLPAIPVPLRYPEPGLTLDLQPLVDGIYSLGRYNERIDYTRPLKPALSRADAALVRSFLKKRGL